MLAVLSGAKILPVGIYAKNYKVRLFRKTYVKFGEVMDISDVEADGLKSKALAVTDCLFEEISRLEKDAQDMAK